MRPGKAHPFSTYAEEYLGFATPLRSVLTAGPCGCTIYVNWSCIAQQLRCGEKEQHAGTPTLLLVALTPSAVAYAGALGINHPRRNIHLHTQIGQPHPQV